MRRNLTTKGAKVLRSFSPLLLFAFFAPFVVQCSAGELFPFVLPWDDASPSATNISSWLEKPAGKNGFVSVQDGHLFSGGKRFRIFGVNMAFGANFPTHADAEKVAARMAKFGINCVRFHHMDMQAAPGGIWAKDMKTFDPEQLDRLDYFIAELKKNGIYTDLNLHVSRTYPDRPKSEKVGNTNYDKGVDLFDAAMIALQKDYARDLLTHVNPYTKTAYVAEPAVALIEINNENALLDEWHNGGLDRAAAPYRDELARLWTQCLRDKYGSDEKLAAAWKEGARTAGPEVLKNGDFADGLNGWYLERHEGAEAQAEVGPTEGANPDPKHANGAPRLRVEVQKLGKESWHAQIGQGGLKLRAGESYAVTFAARSDAARKISVVASQAHEPWKQLGSKEIALKREWQRFIFAFTPKEGDDNARLSFSSLGREIGRYEFTDVSLRTAGIDGALPVQAGGQFAALTRDDYALRTPTAQHDWFAFLWSVEEKYWTGMYAFIREDLKARSLIVGTQLGWSPFPIQSHMDVIDSHAYWQHPNFPNKPWDASDWTVKNVSMAGAPDGGTLPGLALQRVAGKPYICTEYSHPAPNEFCAEMFPLICAYAALQDWDGIFAFAYSHRANDWDKRYFPSFFDIDQHPVKMATLPASLAMFVRGDVQAGEQEALVTVPLNAVLEKARTAGPRLGAEQFGMDRLNALERRVKMQLGNQISLPNDGVKKTGPLSADRWKLAWEAVAPYVMMDTLRSKGVICGVAGGSFTLHDVQIRTENDWSVILLSVMEGEDFKSAKRILITATGRAENTDMKWKSDAHDSVGRDWGHEPSLVEGIAAKITLPFSKNLKAWALDERGQHRAEVPMTDGTIEIGPQYRTLWYEIAE